MFGEGAAWPKVTLESEPSHFPAPDAVQRRAVFSSCVTLRVVDADMHTVLHTTVLFEELYTHSLLCPNSACTNGAPQHSASETSMLNLHSPLLIKTHYLASSVNPVAMLDLRIDWTGYNDPSPYRTPDL